MCKYSLFVYVDSSPGFFPFLMGFRDSYYFLSVTYIVDHSIAS